MKSSMRVHMAPVGFEADRVVIPAKEWNADKIWLLVQSDDNKIGDYLSVIREALEDDGVEVQEVTHDRKDLFDIVRVTRRIIKQEQYNSVFVNLSSGSKMQAIGCMMACMMSNRKVDIQPYYAEPEAYSYQERPPSRGVKNVIEMPRYNLQIPSDMLVNALQVVQRHERIRKKDLLDKLVDAGVMTIVSDPERAPKSEMLTVNAIEENRLVTGLARMEKSVIQPLLEWGFVEIYKVGRHRLVSLTENGKSAAKFFSDEVAHPEAEKAVTAD